jgi:hypothetical protein
MAGSYDATPPSTSARTHGSGVGEGVSRSLPAPSGATPCNLHPADGVIAGASTVQN